MQLTACGGSETENQAHLIMARQSPGYVLVKELIADSLDRRATRVMLDYSKESVGVRYDVDGLWHAVDPRDREAGDVMLAVMKKISALNMDERRAQQEGEFRMKLGNAKYRCQFVSQGTKTGERTILEYIPEKMPFKTLDDLGMREKMRDDFKACLARTSGTRRVQRAAAGRPADVVERGLDGNRPLPAGLCRRRGQGASVHACGERGSVHVRRRRRPDARLRPASDSAPRARRGRGSRFRQRRDGRRVVRLRPDPETTRRAAMRAKDGIEALLRILALKPKQPEKFAATVTAVVNQRLVRLLCETCRQAYEPPEQLLQKLGIPKGRVEVLFREFQPPPPGTKKKKGEPEVCPDCGGLFYKGRTAIFEFIKITDEMRKALLERPRPEVLHESVAQGGQPHLAGRRCLAGGARRDRRQ